MLEVSGLEDDADIIWMGRSDGKRGNSIKKISRFRLWIYRNVLRKKGVWLIE